jgi:hypothetical protein
MNTTLKQSTILIATVSMALLFVSTLPLKGVWALRLFALSLIFFWIGCVLATLKPANRHIRLAVALALASYLIISFFGARCHAFISFFSVQALLHKSLWFCLNWMILGWLMQPKAVIGEKNPENSFLSYILLFLAFAMFHVWFLWSSQHLYAFRYAPLFTLDMSPMLFPAGFYLSFIAQFAAVFYGVELAQHSSVIRGLSKKWVQTAGIILASVFFGLCLAVALFHPFEPVLL